MANAVPVAPAFVPELVDVYEIRQALDLTQRNFAHAFGLRVTTLRDWELGRARPDATARAYLAILGQNAEVVRSAWANTGSSNAS